MLEAPQFSWQQGDTDDGEIVITRGSASTRDIIFELTRQAIGLARRQSTLPHEEGLPKDSELIPLLADLNFPPGREFEVVTPNFTDRLVNIDYLRGLPVKFCLRASTQEVAHNSEPLILSQRLFDRNHGEGASFHILRLAMIALDVRKATTSKS